MQLTVEQLIEELQKFKPDALVWTEGCDCYGKAAGVALYDDLGNVVISRPEY